MIWCLMTPNDLWPRPKTIGFFYSMWYTNIPTVPASLLEILCLNCFHNLTLVDPKWPLTSTKNNKLLVLNVVHLHTKYEICPSFPAWDIALTAFSQFDIYWSTPNDHWPPPKTIWLLLLNVVHPTHSTKYEICRSFPSWAIMFTRPSLVK